MTTTSTPETETSLFLSALVSKIPLFIKHMARRCHHANISAILMHDLEVDLVVGDQLSQTFLSPFLVLAVCEKAFVDMTFFVEDDQSIAVILLQVAEDFDGLISLMKKEKEKHKRFIRIMEDLCTFIGMRLTLVDIFLSLLTPATKKEQISKKNNSNSNHDSESFDLHHQALIALDRVIASQEQIRSKHAIQPLMERAISEAQTIKAYIEVIQAMQQRKYGMTVLGIAKYELLVQNVHLLLSTAKQSDSITLDGNNSSSSVVSINVPASIGICELFHQWREILVADHRIVFHHQLTLTSKWLGEDLDSHNENKRDPALSVVSGEATAVGGFASSSPGAGAGTGAVSVSGNSPGSDVITHTNRNTDMDLGLEIPSIRQLIIHPTQDD